MKRSKITLFDLDGTLADYDCESASDFDPESAPILTHLY